MQTVSTKTKTMGRPLKLSADQMEEFRRLMPMLSFVELAARYGVTEPTARNYAARLGGPGAEGRGKQVEAE
jgi:hypothetical protein